MNYENFLILKNDILKENQNIINMAENNLYAYRPCNLVYDNTGHIENKVYRCHLVEDWLKYYDLPQEYKKNIGVSNGVRNSLDVITEELKDKKYLIPKDVYPFYQKLLNEKNICYKEYKTLNGKKLFEDIKDIEADILLITDPLKPLGRDIELNEYKNIEFWLNENKNRMLIVDCAYTLSNKINEFLFNLYLKTNQVILLYSLSKGWSLPNYLGISLFMDNDFGKYLKEKYKLLEKNQSNLNMAYMALKEKNSVNDLKNILEKNHKKAEFYLNRKLPYSKENISYLYYLEDKFDDLLKKNILSIPATVFGGTNGVIISTLLK